MIALGARCVRTLGGGLERLLGLSEIGVSLEGKLKCIHKELSDAMKMRDLSGFEELLKKRKGFLGESEGIKKVLPKEREGLSRESDDMMHYAGDDVLLTKGIFNGNYDIVNLLIKYKTIKNINYAYLHGNTLLHFAVNAEAPKIAGLLFNNGASADLRNESGKTPVHYAMELAGRHELLHEKSEKSSEQQCHKSKVTHKGRAQKYYTLILEWLEDGVDVKCKPSRVKSAKHVNPSDSVEPDSSIDANNELCLSCYAEYYGCADDLYPRFHLSVHTAKILPVILMI